MYPPTIRANCELCRSGLLVTLRPGFRGTPSGLNSLSDLTITIPLIWETRRKSVEASGAVGLATAGAPAGALASAPDAQNAHTTRALPETKRIDFSIRIVSLGPCTADD